MKKKCDFDINIIFRVTPRSKKVQPRDVKHSTPRDVTVTPGSGMKVSRSMTARKPAGAMANFSKTVTTGARRRPVSVASATHAQGDNVVRKEIARRSTQNVDKNSSSVLTVQATY